MDETPDVGTVVRRGKGTVAWVVTFVADNGQTGVMRSATSKIVADFHISEVNPVSWFNLRPSIQIKIRDLIEKKHVGLSIPDFVPPWQKKMLCRYCGQRIQWREGQGWLTMGMVMRGGSHTYEVTYGTEDCARRDVPEHGHALPPEEDVFA